MILSLAIFLLTTALVIWYQLRKNAPDQSIQIRDLPALDKIRYAVAVAAEKGRPVIFTTGLTNIGPLMYACLEILKHIARLCARLNCKLIVPQNDPPSMALVLKTLEDVYRSEGKLSTYDSQSVVFLSEEQFAFAAGYIGLVKREQVGAALLFGSFAGEALILAESGRNVGAYQVAGSVSPEQLAFFIATCDEVALGDEVYAISAKLSKNPTIMSNLRVGDILKVSVTVGLIFLILSSTLIPELADPVREKIMKMSW